MKVLEAILCVPSALLQTALPVSFAGLWPLPSAAAHCDTTAACGPPSIFEARPSAPAQHCRQPCSGPGYDLPPRQTIGGEPAEGAADL